MRTRSLLLVMFALAAMCVHCFAVLRPQFPPRPRDPGEPIVIVADDAQRPIR